MYAWWKHSDLHRILFIYLLVCQFVRVLRQVGRVKSVQTAKPNSKAIYLRALVFVLLKK